MKRIEELEKRSDETFHSSPEYQGIKKELELLKKEAELLRYTEKIEISRRKNIEKTVEQLFRDNQQMVDNGKYWVGITRTDTEYENQKLARQISKLEAENSQKDEIISFLRDYIRTEIYKDASDPGIDSIRESLKPQKTGRKRIVDDEMRKRIRRYKKDGYTVRTIAKIEGISVGTAQKVLSDLDVHKK